MRPVGSEDVALSRGLGGDAESKPKWFIHHDRSDPASGQRLVDDKDVVHPAGNAVGPPGPTILERKAVLGDASHSSVEIGHNLLRPDDEHHMARS